MLHESRGANSDIEAGEAFLELEPAGGDLKDETAQPATLELENLRGNIVLGLKLLEEPYRSYSGDLRGAPGLLKHLLGNVTLTAVGALIVPNIRELSGPDEWGL